MERGGAPVARFEERNSVLEKDEETEKKSRSGAVVALTYKP